MRWTGAVLMALALCTTPAAAAGTISVPANGNLQTALDQAAPGTTILLPPGAVYVGNFLIRSGVTIRTDGPLPAGRVTPEWSGRLAILQSPNNQPALRTATGVSHVQVVGLEFAPNGHSSGTSVLIGSNTETLDANQPRHVVLDRLLVRGSATNGQKRGVALHGSHITVSRSHISDFKLSGQDTQAIWINNGWGPYTITDNYLEASGENIMTGGDTPRIDQLIPSDILIERNHIVKPLSWKGQGWTVKNLIEFKSAKRAVIRGNWLEGSWVSGQVGYGILLTPKDQYGKAPWTTIQDVLVELNVIHEISEGIRVLGDDHAYPAVRAQDFVIRQNLIIADREAHGGSGRCLVVGRAPQYVDFSDNTCIGNGAASLYTYWGGDVRIIEGGVFRRNVFLHNQYGFSAEGFTSGGIGALNLHYANGVMERNLIGGGASSRYPYDHVLSLSEFQAQFVNYAGGNFRLTEAARQRFTAENAYPGADLDAIMGAIHGTTPPPVTNEPPPAPNTPPVAGHQSVAATAGVPLGIVLTGSDADGDVISFAIASGPAQGVLGGTPPVVTYTAAANYAGPDSFTFTVNDGKGGVATGTVTIAVSAPNGPPTATNQSVAAVSGTPLGLVLAGSDPDGDPLAFAIVSGPTRGTLTGTAPFVTYRAVDGYAGPDSFTFSVNDGRGGVATGTVSISVTLPNRPPTAVSQSVVATSGTPLAIVLSGSDPDGDAISFAVTSSPARGTLSGVAPNLTYTAAAGYVGADSFMFSVSDGRGGVATGIISIDVVAPPVVQVPPPSVTTSSLPDGRLGRGYAEQLEAVDGTAPYTWARIAGQLPGGLSLSSAGVISGTPTQEGTFSFTVRVTDAAGRTGERTLSIRVVSAPGNSGSAPGKNK